MSAMTTAQIAEAVIRIAMDKIRRKNSRGQVLCDNCGEAVATERHHIWPKSLTMGNEEAEAIANGPLVTAKLCAVCHTNIDWVQHRDTLLQKLYVINGRGDAEFGYFCMSGVIDDLAAAMKTNPGRALPCPPERK